MKTDKIDKGQPQKLCICVAFTQLSKLGLHPDMLLSLAYIIKLLKITTKMRMYIFCCIHMYIFCLLTNWYFDSPWASSLNLGDLRVFTIFFGYLKLFSKQDSQLAIWIYRTQLFFNTFLWNFSTKMGMWPLLHCKISKNTLVFYKFNFFWEAKFGWI